MPGLAKFNGTLIPTEGMLSLPADPYTVLSDTAASFFGVSFSVVWISDSCFFVNGSVGGSVGASVAAALLSLMLPLSFSPQSVSLWSFLPWPFPRWSFPAAQRAGYRQNMLSVPLLG